jgi:sterol desaturase/sphingolipid hydroxylase (fatty acid hydroxylase superfamily)
MSTQLSAVNQKRKSFTEKECYGVLLLILAPLIYVSTLLEDVNRFLFHAFLFLIGWCTFTFFEYIAHRFWMHDKEQKHPGKSLERHMNHHRHPTEIKITNTQRTILLTGVILFVALSVWLDNYFTLFTGFYSGFVSYTFMHVILHKRWAGKVFPRLQEAHIHHHCKYPENYYGVCVTWWDRIFNTDVPQAVKISPRIREFYFGNGPHYETAEATP